MKKPNPTVSREQLLHQAGAASLASVIVAAAAGAPLEADADNRSGPFNLAAARQPTKTKVLAAKPGKGPPHKFDLANPIPVDLILTVPHHPTDLDIPDGYSEYQTYYVGDVNSDQPVYLYGKDENGTGEDDGSDHPKKLKHPVYVVMCVLSNGGRT